MSVVSFFLSYGGLLLLAAGMSRHEAAVWGRDTGPVCRLQVRAIGALLLLFGLLFAAWELGLGPGLVSWFAAGSVSGLLIALALAYAPALLALPLFVLLGLCMVP